jgi:hypothetical protein
MKRALITIATVGILAPTAWVVAANAQANINPNVYPGNMGRAVRSEGTSLRPCASLWPFSKICPASLPSLCPCPSTVWR